MTQTTSGLKIKEKDGTGRSRVGFNYLERKLGQKGQKVLYKKEKDSVGI